MGKMLRQHYDADIHPMEGFCTIDQDYRKLLEEMIDLGVQIYHFKNVDKFVCGFKLGVKFILEIMEDTP